MDEELAYWLALRRAPGVGDRSFPRLIERFGGARALFDAGASAWRAHALSAATVKYLQAPDWASVERDLEWGAGEHRYILPLTDARYPYLLRQIADPPAVLFVRGNPEVLAWPQLAMVGSRHANL